MDKVVKIFLCLLGFFFHTSLYLLSAQLSPAAQTQQVLVAIFVWSFLFVVFLWVFVSLVLGGFFVCFQ